ncbi:MAG: hypothetical protein NUV64_03245 [Parcubacteria group bacterium]|nr:hypothetical protein [Parcubacteria group bacterium]MCR4343071.1 hypothetical protein [Patescibacteria group bacterium]
MNIELIIFLVVLLILLTKIYARGAIPTVLKAVSGKKETSTKAEERKKTAIERFRESAGIPLSYILLFGILFHVSWVRPYLTHNWILTAMAIVTMMAIDMLTGVTAKSWEESIQRKKARFHLNAGLTLLLIYIVALVGEWSWNTKTDQTPTIPTCAKNYNFSKVKPSGKVIVRFRHDCTTKVTLPPNVAYRTRPNADYKIRFIDGAEFIGGPGRQVWLGARKGLFQVIGLSSGGTIEIFLEKA